MQLTAACRLLASAPLCAKRAKGEFVLVHCASVVSGYKIQKLRSRTGEKVELMSWDPLVQKTVLFREDKKVKSIPSPHQPNRERIPYELLPSQHDAPVPREYSWYRLPKTKDQ